MFDLISNLGLGLTEVVNPANLGLCFVGVLLGTLVGVLPGIGPSATIAMLLPVTFSLSPTGSLIMLAGIYYGAQYGGSTTAILINLPGEASSIVTAIDGHQMARKGRAGIALSTAAIGSFFAGSVATLLIAIFAPPLARLAQVFGPVEYTSLMITALLGSIVIGSGSLVKSLGMIVLGLLVASVGLDSDSGLPRFTFGTLALADGFDLVTVAMGLFGLGEIMSNLQHGTERQLVGAKIGSLMPRGPDFKRMTPPILRGTILGSLLGVLPGGGALLSSFAAYAIEKRVSRNPAEFGQGALEGVAGPESANNAAAQTSFIPMLTLGVPSNAVMALMIGAMMIQGIQPGPSIITEQSKLFWAIIVSMWIGNAFLLLLNLPLVGMWVRLAQVPYRLLFLGVLIFAVIGIFTVSNNPLNIYIMTAFGIMGFLFQRLGCEPAPFMMGFLLGPLLEENFRRSLVITGGDLTAFVRSPISATLLALTVLGFIIVMLPKVRVTRKIALAEDA